MYMNVYGARLHTAEAPDTPWGLCMHKRGGFVYLKASPLPPAPLATSWLLICRLDGFERFVGFKSLEIKKLHNSFQADFIHFASQIYWFFEVLGDHFSSILGLGTPLFHYFGDQWVQGSTQTEPELIFGDFWWILGLPLETLLHHFFIFSLIWTVQNHIWIAVTFFDDFWMEILLNSDVLILQMYCKYVCFH